MLPSLYIHRCICLRVTGVRLGAKQCVKHSGNHTGKGTSNSHRQHRLGHCAGEGMPSHSMGLSREQLIQGCWFHRGGRNCLGHWRMRSLASWAGDRTLCSEDTAWSEKNPTPRRNSPDLIQSLWTHLINIVPAWGEVEIWKNLEDHQ